MGYVFDALVISAVGVEITRPVGPVEPGRFSGGVWVPEPGAQKVMVDGFGVDPAGNPYFDTVAVDPGDHASLFVEPSTGQLWLED